MYLLFKTNRFQRTSQRDKNISDPHDFVSWATFLLLPRCNVMSASITKQTTAKWDRFVNLMCVGIVVVSTHRVTVDCLLIFHRDYDVEQSSLWAIHLIFTHTPLGFGYSTIPPPRKKHQSVDTMIHLQITTFSNPSSENNHLFENRRCSKKLFKDQKMPTH